jgi:AcrR family transcriptional regulator
MNEEEGNTLNRILQCGKEEFLRKGFAAASLRHIVKQAGVTTGAFYGYFPDKMALFHALVAPAAEGLREYFLSIQQKFVALPPDQQAVEMPSFAGVEMAGILDYIYNNYDAFKLILCCSEGTPYANYIDSIVEIESEYTLRFIETMQGAGYRLRELDPHLMHMLANALFSGIFEVVVHDTQKEEAAKNIKELMDFFTAGWIKIFGM